MSCGIYAIRSICKPNRIYIGSSIKIDRRCNSHKSNLKHNRHANQKLQSHYNKYGAKDLIFDVIIDCDPETLVKAEQAFIDMYRPWFNIRKTAESNRGIIASQETRAKMSVAAKRHGTPWLKGRKQSEEHKLKHRLNHSHKTHTEEELRKMRLSKQCKIIINIETGIFYDSITEAAQHIHQGHTPVSKRTMLSRYLRGAHSNKTMFRYA